MQNVGNFVQASMCLRVNFSLMTDLSYLINQQQHYIVTKRTTLLNMRIMIKTSSVVMN